MRKAALGVLTTMNHVWTTAGVIETAACEEQTHSIGPTLGPLTGEYRRGGRALLNSNNAELPAREIQRRAKVRRLSTCGERIYC